MLRLQRSASLQVPAQENRNEEIGMTLETVQRNRFLKQDRNIHRVRPHFPPTITLPYHQRQWIDVKHMIRLLRHHQTVPREVDGAVEFRTLAPMFHSKFTSSPYWSIRTWLSCLQRGGGPEKRFQCCVDPYSADTILFLRVIQGHSGGKHINPTLQDNVLLPNDFAEHIYHGGNSHDSHSIIQSGLIPGEKDIKKGRRAVFFTAVNPTFIDHYRERDYDVTKPKIAVYKLNWKTHQNTVYWCNWRVAHSKGLQFYLTRSNAIILYNTLPAVCIEKVVIRMSGEELSCKTFQSPILLQRIVLKPNLHYGRQDTTSSGVRKSFDHSDKHDGTCREACRGEMDFRVQGLPHSTVQEQDHIRKEAVQKLIHQFETHPNREALKADLKQKSHSFKPYSDQSKELIHSMRNMECFEICDSTPKVQCHNCTTNWTKGIVYCTCGTCLRLSDKTRKLNKDRFDVLSIPNHVIKKGPSHGARHGNTGRQRIYHAAHVSAKKAKKTATMKLETVHGDLLRKQDRNKHQHRRLLQRLRYHTTSVNDRRRTRRVRPKLFSSFEENDLREQDGAVEFNIMAPMFASKIRVFSALVNSNMTELFAKKRRSQEEISVLLGSLLSRDSSLPSSNSCEHTHMRGSSREFVVRTSRVMSHLHALTMCLF